MKKIIFFHNKGGVGKTTLVYHFAYMLEELGYKCLAVDLDPQANLSSLFLTEEQLENIYQTETERATIISGIKPLDTGTGDIAPVKIHEITGNIGLIAGDLDLSLFEEKLSAGWDKCLDGDENAFQITSSLSRIIAHEGRNFGADYCIIDLGPNLSALNRAALIAADFLIVPLTADLYALQGLKNIGARLNRWKAEWTERVSKNRTPHIPLPKGDVKPLGYIIIQQGVTGHRPIQYYYKWANKIPAAFNAYIGGKPGIADSKVEEDPNCLALLKYYYSLAPMATEARKPIFQLRPADGAIGANLQAVLKVYSEYKSMVEKVVSLTSS